jgi:hypothetical protein
MVTYESDDMRFWCACIGLCFRGGRDPRGVDDRFLYVCINWMLYLCFDDVRGKKMKNYTDQDIKNLAFDALNHACGYIQYILKIEEGDLAGMFFTGANDLMVRDTFERYIREEIAEAKKNNFIFLRDQLIEKTFNDMSSGDLSDFFYKTLVSQYDKHPEQLMIDIKRDYPEIIGE